MRMEFDDPGLQPQTGAQPGQLRETDVGGRGESAAKRLKWAAAPFFPLASPLIVPDGYPHGIKL